MTEWILSSSILILIVIGLRTVFKGKISLRLQYAIWGLVLLRLLIPVSFGSTDFSVANLTAKPQTPSFVIESTEPDENVQAEHPQEQLDEIPLQPIIQNEPTAEERSFDLKAYTTHIIWGIGFVAVAALFLFTNLRFKHKVLASRSGLDVRKNNLDVYTTEEIDTPCLFGILNPAIYITYPVADNQTLLRHTLEHEATHHRHGDHIWAFLRCVCLAIHWYNPLVWWAAFLSQRDAELACDEATIEQLGEGERAEYGRTLIGMTCQKKANVLITATTMNSGKSGLKERIMLIAKKPKMALYTLITVVLIASMAVGCTFTGAKANKPEPGTEVVKANGDILDNEGNVIKSTEIANGDILDRNGNVIKSTNSKEGSVDILDRDGKPTFTLYRVSKEEAAGFSYEEVEAVYLADGVKFNDETEIKKNGFLNITKCAVEDTVEAYERAKNECFIPYDRVSVFYDSSSDMWQVFFFTSGPNGHSGDRQLVYLGGDGITRLIVICPQSKTTKPTEEIITLTLTPQYAPDTTDEWLEANIGTYHQSFERLADNSIVVKMTSEQYRNYVEYIRSGIISITQNMVANDHNSITDISFNDNFSEFQVTVKTDTLYRSDANSAYYVFTAYGRFYHYLINYQQLTSGLEEGLEDYSVAVTFLDADGNILEDNYKPE